ncbi:MAG: amino acid adenylation domain-containing protein [Candidatus Symbiodolus clandestinus]
MGCEMKKKNKTCFIFPGQGNQWPGMCLELLEHNSFFLKAMFECDKLYNNITDFSILSVLRSPEKSIIAFEDITKIQPILFCIHYSLSKVWESLGISAAGAIGHSLGEISAACYCGHLSLKDALIIVHSRVKQLKAIAKKGDGGMMAIHLPQAAVEKLISNYPNLYISVYNSDNSFAISGNKNELESLASILVAKDIFYKMLAVNHASHSPYISQIKEALQRELTAITPHSGSKIFFSTRYGYAVPGNTLTSDYWAESELNPVLFSSAVEQAALYGYTHYIEISPHPIILNYAAEMTHHCKMILIPTMFRNRGFNDCREPYTKNHSSKPANPPLIWQDDGADTEIKVIREALTSFLSSFVMSIHGNISPDLTLIDNGLDSLSILTLKKKIDKYYAINLSLHNFFALSLNEIVTEIIAQSNRDNKVGTVGVDNADLSEPETKVLTDIQQAYLLGADKSFPDGGIIAHIYSEQNIEKLDFIRYRNAWEKVIRKHVSLRTLYQNNVPGAVNNFRIDEVVHLRDISHCRSIKNELKKERYKNKTAYLSREESVRVSVNVLKLTRQNYKTCVYIDLIAVDAISLHRIFRELSYFYSYPEVSVVTDNSYQSYIGYLNQQYRTQQYISSRHYWKNKKIFPSPNIPTNNNSAVSEAIFGRKKIFLTKDQYSKLKTITRRNNLSPSVMLAAIYAITIATWSKNQSFSLNFMISERPEETELFAQTVGNFSSTILVDIHFEGKSTFRDFSAELQRDLWEKLSYASVSGVEAMQLAMKGDQNSQPALPFVFSSALNTDDFNSSPEQNLFTWIGERTIYSYLETPQVWLDNQVFEDREGGIVIHWDYKRNRFYPGLMDEMFNAYSVLLCTLIDNQIAWNSQIKLEASEQFKARLHQNQSTDELFDDRMLIDGILKHAIASPERVALQSGSQSLTYDELLTAAKWVTSRLMVEEKGHGKPVALYMDKGLSQICAVAGILLCNYSYLPLALNQGHERLKTIINKAECKIICTSNNYYNEIQTLFPGKLVIDIDSLHKSRNKTNIDSIIISASDTSQTAYTIFTSGSTGTPKGVEIAHCGAANTCLDINRKFNVSDKDVIYSVSELCFDLSVYDIFGTFFAGATLVIPSKAVNDPTIWFNDIFENRVTLWNSSPSLFQLLADYITAAKLDFPDNLRLVLLSGDWIPLNLAGQLVNNPSIQFVSLGGATEASIWSIYYPVKQVKVFWTSIPYGTALANQNVLVLDENLEECLPLITGDIYIAGKGLAKGYLNSPRKTAAAFLIHPKTKQRLYNTGDKGRYNLQAEIEFLGREDNQVKIHGYRIELGEIEAALNVCQGVLRSIVKASRDNFTDQVISAYIQCGADASLLNIKKELSSKLPIYMIPSVWYRLDEIALTANGKLERSHFPKARLWTTGENLGTENKFSPVNELLLESWKSVLGELPADYNLSFFDLGGSSFKVLRLIHDIKQRLGVTIELGTFYEYSSLRSLSRFISGEIIEQDNIKIIEDKGDGAAFVFVYPIGGATLCYHSLIKALASHGTILAIDADYNRDYSCSSATLSDIVKELADKLLTRYRFDEINFIGWSMGGVIGYEIADYLSSQERSVSVTMLDSPLPGSLITIDDKALQKWFIRDLGERTEVESELAERYRIFKFNQYILCQHIPVKSQIPVFYVNATIKNEQHYSSVPEYYLEEWGWRKFAKNILRTCDIQCDHYTLMNFNHANLLKSEILCFISEIKGMSL